MKRPPTIIILLAIIALTSALNALATMNAHQSLKKAESYAHFTELGVRDIQQRISRIILIEEGQVPAPQK